MRSGSAAASQLDTLSRERAGPAKAFRVHLQRVEVMQSLKRPRASKDPDSPPQSHPAAYVGAGRPVRPPHCRWTLASFEDLVGLAREQSVGFLVCLCWRI